MCYFRPIGILFQGSLSLEMYVRGCFYHFRSLFIFGFYPYEWFGIMTLENKSDNAIASLNFSYFLLILNLRLILPNSQDPLTSFVTFPARSVTAVQYDGVATILQYHWAKKWGMLV